MGSAALRQEQHRVIIKVINQHRGQKSSKKWYNSDCPVYF